MKAAIVREAGRKPTFGDFDEPAARAGASVVTVTGSALSHITKQRAEGTHYTATAAFPFVAGLDGSGVLADGRRVYFFQPEAPFGGMAERTLVDERRCVALPDALDAVTAAALAIPGMSSWVALRERARFLQGETVQIARHFGARRVVATGRNPAALAALPALGADAVIALTDDRAALEDALRHEFAQGVDVVLDYLWGVSAETLLAAAAKSGPAGVPIRVVQVGSVSGATIALPAAALRSSSIVMMGSGLGSVGFPQLRAAITGVFEAARPAGLAIEAQRVPLAEVEAMWDSGGSDSRLVFVP